MAAAPLLRLSATSSLYKKNIMNKLHSTEILLKQNSKAVKVVVLSSTKTLKKNKSFFEMYKFKANYGQAVYSQIDNTIFVGSNFVKKQKSMDPFYKLDWYHLGAITAKCLNKINANSAELRTYNADFPIEDFERYVLGIMQASWHYDEYLPEDSKKSTAYSLYISDDLIKSMGKQALIKSIDKIKSLDNSIRLVRTIVNEPPETLHPYTAAELIKKTFSTKRNVSVKIYDEKWLDKNSMNGITFVGRGSRYQPRLVHVTIKPKSKPKHKVVLIGKGLTYDSGGLDIKIGGNMKTMKMDMAGAATMFGVARVASEISLNNVEVHWLSAFAENMIGPNSYKSDDIITTYSGQTVEVFNTDAEGRLTLADVLSYATTLNPDYIIDAATLTGAAIVALSDRFTAVMGNDSDLVDGLVGSFQEESEPSVYVPMPESLRSSVKGEISDLINTSKLDRQAGHITAGLFLSHFVDQNLFRNSKVKIKKPREFAWAHLDIAGSAYNNGNNSLGAVGATGQSVRGLLNWLIKLDSK